MSAFDVNQVGNEPLNGDLQMPYAPTHGAVELIVPPKQPRKGHVRAKVIRKRVEAPKAPHCSACLRTKEWLKTRRDVFECSHVECPERRRLTAGEGWV